MTKRIKKQFNRLQLIEWKNFLTKSFGIIVLLDCSKGHQ